MHGLRAHPNLKLIIPKFWLDQTHSDYHTLDWGQTPRGLPWYAREEFLRLYPNHSESKLITWGQFMDLRARVVCELQRAGVKVFHGTPQIKRLQNGFRVAVGESHFNASDDAYFYNIYRVPNVEHQLGAFGNTSHTELYTMPKEDVPKTAIILGGGRSAIWAANHFPSTLFAIINRDGSQLPLFENETMPHNIIEYTQSELDGKKFVITPTQESVNDNDVQIIDLENKRRSFRGAFFCAIGLRYNSELTHMISKKNLLSPSEDKLTWIHQEETPVGSLMEATLRWAHLTENLSWAYETFCYHEEYFADALCRDMEKVGINLPYSFFDKLRPQIMNLPQQNPLKQVPIRAPSEKQILQVYRKAFIAACDGTVRKSEVAAFEEKLIEVASTRLAKHNAVEYKNSYFNAR